MFRLVFGAILLFTIHIIGQPNIIEEEISYQNGSIQLAASVLLPQSANQLPAAVIVHGSGNSDRSNPWTTAYANALSERGIIVLHPDKRGSGESSGDWKTASLEDLANDVLAAVDYLLTRNEVDTSKIALIGFSQGGNVIPIAATLSDKIDLVIDISGSVVTLKEQIIDEVQKEAVREGVEKQGMKEIKKLNELVFKYAYGEIQWNEYSSELERVSKTEIGKTNTFEGFPNQKDIWVWDWINMNTKVSPLDYWKKINVPILFIYGGNDTQIDIKKSIDLIYSELEPLQKNFSILYFNSNGHALFRNDCNDFISNWIEEGGVN